MLRRGRDDVHSGPHRPRILVVNDEPDAAELLVRVLRSAPEGYEVDRAGDQLTLTARLVADPPVDAVVVDVASGGIGGGLKILDAVRGSLDPHTAGLPVVLVSPSQSSAMFSWQAGVDELLVRPFHANDLLAAVSSAMARPEDERPRYRRQELEAAKTRKVRS
jgi:DNA-binding response OmpR family regulator